ncbi:hypothetical protein [Candidatus Tisiphia endosymbiont of Sialis lutaria]|uniref:hypothetical protein n=1 Tax=Candidatus Tisiphia endosymbiont of Sialis lutaria TaxID=2029164 RepID=UPI00312CBBA1
MSKLNQHRYLDQKEEILYTANNLYDYSLDKLAGVESLRQTKGCSQKTLMEGYEAIESYFKEALLFGEGSSGYPLAYLHFNGYGVKKDLHQAKLYVAIGANFKDENCIKLMRGEDPKILGNTSGTNMGKWLKYDYADVIPEAMQWVKAIQTITTRCSDKDAEITSPDIVWAEAQLKYHCEEPLAAQAQEDPCKESPSLYPTLPHNEGGASTSRFEGSMHPLGQVDETAMTGRDAQGSSCCVVI